MSKDKSELNSALSEFENELKTDEMKERERPLLNKANYEKELLESLESTYFKWFWSDIFISQTIINTYVNNMSYKPKIYWTIGSDFDPKMYMNSRRRLMRALESKDLGELDSALGEFEGQLATEEMKINERHLLEMAYEEKEYLVKLRVPLLYLFSISSANFYILEFQSWFGVCIYFAA